MIAPTQPPSFELESLFLERVEEGFAVLAGIKAIIDIQHGDIAVVVTAVLHPDVGVSERCEVTYM
jgi:hypothetical protein